MKAAIQSVVAAWGQIDITVNNAGIGGAQYSWDQLIAVNQNGVYYGCLHSFQQMVKQGKGGAIVNLSSMMGLVGSTPMRGIPGGVGYGYHASKHAVIGLTKQFGLDGAPHNIRVNALCPGWIDTPLVAPLKMMEPLLQWAIEGTPMGRLGTAGGDREGGALPVQRRLFVRDRHAPGDRRRLDGEVGLRPAREDERVMLGLGVVIGVAVADDGLAHDLEAA